MRLDKFLQASGIVRRRTRAQELCERGYVMLDGRPAKAGKSVRPGQRIRVQLGSRILTFEVRALPERPVSRDRREDIAQLLESRTVDGDL
ncbi:MAG: S4 domain-containing protein [Armatimonadota bacterium]